MAHLTAQNEHGRAALNALRELTKHGLPKPVADAHADAQATVDNVADLSAEATPERVADLFTRLARGGKDRPTDEQVSRAVLANVAATQPRVFELVKADALALIMRTMREHAPALVEVLRPTVEQAAADLDKAAAVLVGVEDLTDLQAVTDLGGEAAEAWKQARAAEDALMAAERTLWLLARAGCYPDTGDARERRLAVLDATFEGYRHVKAQTRPWELRRRGTIALATADELTERIARVDAEWAEHPDNPATRIGPGAGQFPTDRATAVVL